MKAIINNKEYRISLIKQMFLKQDNIEFIKSIYDIVGRLDNLLTQDKSSLQFYGLTFFEITFNPEDIIEDDLYGFLDYFNKDKISDIKFIIGNKEETIYVDRMVRIQRPNDSNSNYVISFKQIDHNI